MVVSGMRESEQPIQTGGEKVGPDVSQRSGGHGAKRWQGHRRDSLTDGGGLADGLVLEEDGVLVRLVTGPGLVRAQGVVVLVLCVKIVSSVSCVF